MSGDFDLFYLGRFSISEPGISLCGCGKHYTPTPLSHGRCERCRRPDTQNAVDRARIDGDRGIEPVAADVAAPLPYRPRRKGLGRGLDALLGKEAGKS